MGEKARYNITTFDPSIESLTDDLKKSEVVEVLEQITFKAKAEPRLIAIDRDTRDYLVRVLNQK